VNRYGEQASVPVICEVDPRPSLQGPFDTGAEFPIGQDSFGYIGNQEGVADNGIAVANFFDGQVIWQVTETDDFNPIVKQFVDHFIINRILVFRSTGRINS
jgi:hypothetical protein